MLLTKPQHSVFQWLREFGGLRTEHIVALMKMKYGDEVLHLEPILNQLIQNRMAQKDGDLYTAFGSHAEPGLLEAFDLMLLLSTKDIQTARRGTDPFLLTFFKQKEEKLYRYDVVAVPEGREPIVCAQLEGINHKYRVIILMLDNLKQQKLLHIGCEHCFAVNENGEPRFYKFEKEESS